MAITRTGTASIRTDIIDLIGTLAITRVLHTIGTKDIGFIASRVIIITNIALS
jgi:hypothetical protein